VGVHEFQADYWHLLAAAHAATRIVVEDAGTAEFMDLR
jgi:hypothetical protein